VKRLRAIVGIIATTVLVGAAATAAGASPALAQAGVGSLAGVVHDSRGAVVSGATIMVYPADGSGSEVARTTTGAAGTFRVSPLKVGGYNVLIDRDGWSEWAPGRITDDSEARAYRVVAGRTTVALSVVTAAGAIAGRVTAPTGGPAAGIVVTVTDRNTASAWDTVTAANGRYSVSLPPGTAYEVAFTNGELTQFSPRTLDPSEARLYTVRSGRTTRVNERLLAPAVLVGRLVDESGTPVAGAQVIVAITATAGEARTTTGPDGRYRFEALPPGDVTVGFIAPDGREQWAYQETSPAEADLITLSLGTVTTVDEMLLPLTAAALAGLAGRR